MLSMNQGPQVGIEDFGDFAIQIGIRYWVPTKSYYEVMYAANNEIYKALKAANITIPYPRQIVQINEKAG